MQFKTEDSWKVSFKTITCLGEEDTRNMDRNTDDCNEKGSTYLCFYIF